MKERNDHSSPVKNDIEKYLLHYHIEQINKRNEFKNRQLKETWGEGQNFNAYINSEVEKYCENLDNYDPFTISCAVRKKVEKNIYDLIRNEEHKNTFLNDPNYNGTKKKLEFAESIGIKVKEVYFILGIIYNDALHWKDNRDNITPLALKLRNKTIKKLICNLFK